MTASFPGLFALKSTLPISRGKSPGNEVEAVSVANVMKLRLKNCKKEFYLNEFKCK